MSGATDLRRDAVIGIGAVIGALSIDAHLQELVDGGVHGPAVGAQHALDHLVVHAGEHGLEVLHGLVELQPPHLPGWPAVVELARARAAPGAPIAAAAPEQTGHGVAPLA